MNREILISCGIDYDEGVAKFLDEAELYEKLLMDFPEDNTFEEARVCMKNHDYEGLEKAVHAMKSVTGTLSMHELYSCCSQTVSLVRSGDYDFAEKLFEKTYDKYQKITEGIKLACG